MRNVVPTKKAGATMFGFRERKGLVVAAILLGLSASARAADERTLYASLGDTTRAPIGWVQGRSVAATRHRDDTGGLARSAQGQPLGQRDRQADDRHGSLGRGGKM